MRLFPRLFVSFVFIFILLSNSMPCGPGYISPMFDTTKAPEDPYLDYATGKLGIVKPTYKRSVLYVAYRYIVGNGMTNSEQQAMIEVWNAQFDNEDFRKEDIDEAVKAWVAKRKQVFEKEKLPDIYVERSYGGYDFFPNCTKNAFETAEETLSDRISSHGPSDPGVQDWTRSQDQVFQNCSSGKQVPNDAAPGSPQWLQKDRAYQLAAASFYSLDYDDAKRRFAEIAQDTESPWQETADYLVARTLIRQASLTKSKERSDAYYEEAEGHLRRFISRSGKFSNSAEKLTGLIKYRLRPKERVSELAKNLTMYAGGENFRQDVIDYNWLLDKFESEELSAQEKRRLAELAKKDPANNVPANVGPSTSDREEDVPDGMMKVGVYLDPYLSVIVALDATDDETIAAVESKVGKTLTKEQRDQVRSSRQTSYSNRFTDNRDSGYEGGYWGDETLTPSLMPDFLKQDELTDWLYTYEMAGEEAYLYSLDKYKASDSPLWLMTTISKATPASSQLKFVMDAAMNSNRSSAAWPTISYHLARLLLATGDQAKARTVIDDSLALGDQLPQSSKNSFHTLRLKLAVTLEDYLTDSLLKPYGFDFDGDVSTVDAIIERQKTWYDPEYNKEGREAYEAEVEETFAEAKRWQGREMFDSDVVDIFNQHFPTDTLIQVEKNKVLPEYLRGRFLIAIWTRAYLLDNMATALAVTPELIRYYPDLEPLLSKVTEAKTQAAMDSAALYFVLKTPMLSPYLEEGMGKTNNEQEQWSSDDWWCEPYDQTYNETTNEQEQKALPKRPPFITAEQTKLAQSERKRLKATGDAPKFLGEKVLAWAKRSPADKRVPEALYIVIEANGWNKYGCGNDNDLREILLNHLRRNHPSSPWTTKLNSEESEK